MQRLYKTLWVCAFLGLTASANAQTDVTSQYLKNADFEGNYTIHTEYSKNVAKDHRAIYQPQDWDVVYENGDKNDYSVLKEGDLLYSASFKGNFINLDEKKFGKQAYRVRFRWGNAELLKLQQSVTLPAGAYELSADIIGNDKGKMHIFAGKTKSIGNVTDSKWKNVSVTFRSDGTTPIMLGVAFERSKDDQQNGVDNFKLTAVIDKTALNAAIANATTANATLNDGDLQTAVATAQTLADSNDATQEAVDEAVKTLAQAVKTASTKDGANVTYLLTNPSFEDGDTGWSHDNGSDTKVKTFAADEDKTGCDGEYYFNAYDYNNTKNKKRYVSQTVKGLAAGYYQVKAAVQIPSAAQVMLKVGDGEEQQLAASAEHPYTTVESNLVAVDEGASLTIQVSTEGDGDKAWFRADHFQLVYTTLETGAKAGYADLVKEAKALLSPVLGEGEKDAYEHVTGVERQNLQQLVDKEVTSGFYATTETLTAAIQAFREAKISYDAFVLAKTAETTELPYALADKLTAFENAKQAGEPSSAEDATAKANAIYSALRAYVESNGIAEAVEGTEDLTSSIANPSFTKNIDGWTYSQTGGTLGWKNNEPYTLADGSNGGYFDYYNGSANNQEVTTEVYDLSKGDYLLMVCARAQQGFTNFSMSVCLVNDNDELTTDIAKTALPAVGNEGGVFGYGWNDTSLKFTLDKDQLIGIKVANGPVDGKNVAGWYSFSRVRLVKIGDGTATGIALPTARHGETETLYNLAGQRVDKDYRGLVIKNGKKIIIK